MSVFWLRGAVVLYFVSLLHVAVLLVRKRSSFFRLSLSAFSIAVLLHVVSVVEEAHLIGQLPANNFYESISLFGLLVALAFLFVYWRYRFDSLAIIIYPVVFLMTMAGALGNERSLLAEGPLRDAWLLFHVLLVLLGYAALLLTAAASLLYLVHEWQLKQKQPHPFAKKLPPLLVTDALIHQAMVWGFIFLTLGVITGSVWAYLEAGTGWITDPKIAISLFTWLCYFVMILLRVSAGWRGRRAAIMVLYVLGFSAITWVSHSGLQSILSR